MLGVSPSAGPGEVRRPADFPCLLLPSVVPEEAVKVWGSRNRAPMCLCGQWIPERA